MFAWNNFSRAVTFVSFIYGLCLRKILGKSILLSDFILAWCQHKLELFGNGWLQCIMVICKTSGTTRFSDQLCKIKLDYWIRSFYTHCTFSSEPSLQSWSPSQIHSDTRHSLLWGHRCLLLQRGSLVQLSSSERSLQSGCPSHCRLADTHWPLVHVNSLAPQPSLAKATEGR